MVERTRLENLAHASAVDDPTGPEMIREALDDAGFYALRHNERAGDPERPVLTVSMHTRNGPCIRAPLALAVALFIQGEVLSIER
jgi:hypothetical protein